jgi:ribonuclease HIII
MSSLSRRNRREYAKQIGLLAKKENYNQMVGRYQRSNQAGEHLHTHYLQELKNYQIEGESASTNTTQNPQEEGAEINPFGFLGKK